MNTHRTLVYIHQWLEYDVIFFKMTANTLL